MGDGKDMIIKIIGSLIIIISSTYYGISISKKYVKRVENIRNFQISLKIIESEISFLQTPVIEVFEKVDMNLGGRVGKVFKDTVLKYKKNKGIIISNLFENELVKAKEELFLNKEDIEVISSFCRQLGLSDINNQINIINHAYCKLELNEKEAQADKEKNVKLIRSLGLLFGVMLVLIFI
jgi:stage III sporulation protein AB